MSKKNDFRRTIQLDHASSVAILRTVPKFATYRSFASEVSGIKSPLDEQEMMTMREDPALASDDEDSVTDDVAAGRMQPDLPCNFHVQLPETESDLIKRVDFECEEKKDTEAASPKAELMMWHCQLGHLSFGRIRNMAKRGDLLARLANCRVPKCSACMCCKATRLAWRTKAPVNQMTVPLADRPGAVVAVDQLTSLTPGLIGQMRGFLTRKRHKVTTAFVDHHSGCSCVHFQQTTSALETLEAKRCFERFAKSHRTRIGHCHADNGVFEERGIC